MNLLQTIGNTPLVELTHISKNVKARIFSKLEFMNPSGSIKDRIAKYMVEKAEADGKLKPGDTIIENSSGNTALGLAIVCRQKGYKLKIVIRDTTSKEKLQMLEVLGVDVIKVDAKIPPEEKYSYNNLAQSLSENDKSLFYIDQHNNLNNNETYYETLGPEVWQQREGKIDYLVAGIGTGGSLFGSAKYLKEKNPKIKIIGIDPIGSIFYDYFKSGKIVESKRYFIEGIGDEFLIKTAQLEYIDDMIQVTDKKAFGWAKKLAFEEGIIAGGSSGANIYGALKLAKEIDEEANIVTLFPDSGFRYLSSIYNDKWMRKENLI
ncbi:MAG: cysteine synthase family protein [Melioribacteraceae bacterium]|nr:cysteine synthase family protein [Melioribacteraceae bacterium]